ncbi:MAG: translocation/assembly module TamB domain-containing protein [Lysobacteraceae bacterium]
MSAPSTPSNKAPAAKPRRRWYWHIGIGGVVLIVIVSALLGWLLWTASGRDTLLHRVVSLLPAGSLTWERADGVVYGPLTFYGLHYHHAGVDMRAQRVRLDPSLRQLFGRRLRLITLEMDNATLDLPIDRTPQPLPSWPGSLPKFAMPFALSADSVHVRALRVTREGTPLIVAHSIDGGLTLALGLIALDHVVIASDRGQFKVDGHIDVGSNYATRLNATAQLPPRYPGVEGASVQVLAGGNLDHFVLSLHGDAPATFATALRLDNGRTTPRWSLSIDAPRIDPSLLLVPYPPAASSETVVPATPYAIALQAEGIGGSAKLQGRIAQGERAITIAPSQLAYEQGVVQAQPLVLQLLDGDLSITGHADLRPQSPAFDVIAQGDHLRWSAAKDAAPVDASGKLALAGTVNAWSVHGAVDLLRDKQRAQLTLAGNGDRSQITLKDFSAKTPAGGMRGKGQLHWSPQVAWTADAKLAGIDPGYFAPGFEGAVSGHLQTEGGVDANGILSLHAAADGLSGQLRGRRLAGHGIVDWKADIGQTDIDLRIGASHVQAKGAFGRALDLQARFDPLRLDDLLPDAQGALSGEIALRGDPSSPAIAGHLQGSGLHWRGYGAEHVLLDGNLQARENGALQVDADGISGITGLKTLKLRVTGSEQKPRIEGDLNGEFGSIALSASAEHQGALWNGRIASLHYTPLRGTAWSLSNPSTFRYDGKNAVGLSRSCMVSSGASICIDADWPHRANLQAHALPLNLLDPWLVRPDLDLRAYGTVDADAHFAPAGKGWSGAAQVQSSEGGLQLQPALARPLFGYTNLVAHAQLDGEHLQLRIDSALTAGGTLHAQVATSLAADAALTGHLDVALRDITWMELFSIDIAAPKGQLDGHLVLGGSRTHPVISGRAVLDAFEAELPGLGIALKQGHIELDADPSGAARINGSLHSGDGTLVIGGALRWNDPEAPLTVTLKGQNVRIADTPELSAIASPDLQLGYASGTLKIRGKVDVPTAQLNLERLDNTVSPSPDVVVLDPVEKTRSSPLVVDLDLMLALGDAVKLKGFGLDGKLSGQLRVRQASGGPMSASGGLDVSGRYAAYGQQLEIVRGRLGYNGGGFDNPNLDILAQREFDQATIGVQVRGTALQPRTQIISTPAMESSDALAYLVLGRPLQTASADEGRQVSAAAAALSVGSNLIAQKVGARLGLDEAGVSESRALGGSAFTVGKYLSPRLFISYGVSLVGTGEVITLKYLLRKGFDIQVESSRENRASINWRIEK